MWGTKLIHLQFQGPNWGFYTNMVLVDWLTKYAHITPCHPFTAEEAADLFIKEVVRLHGFPSIVVSNKGGFLWVNFGTSYLNQSKTQLYLSSTNQLTSKSCQPMRCFTSCKPGQWPHSLSWTEFWYNASYHSSTKMFSFKALYGRDVPLLFNWTGDLSVVEAVNQLMAKRNAALDELKYNLVLTQNKMKQYAEKRIRDVS